MRINLIRTMCCSSRPAEAFFLPWPSASPLEARTQPSARTYPSVSPGLTSREVDAWGELRQPQALHALPAEPGHPHHRPHHLSGLGELLEQVVDLVRGGARPAGDPQPPASAADSGVPPLLRGHRADDRLRPGELALVDLQILELLLRARDPRQHGQDVLEGTELLHLAHLLEEVLQGELGPGHLLGGLGRLLLV